jgi:hypothetical protein
MMMRILASLLPLLWTLQVPSPDGNPCDSHLVQAANNPYGYRLRGDRCEGLYAQEVVGAPLTIASWTESFEEYDLKSSEPLVISWEVPENGRVQLRAQSVRRRLYFRMDANPASTNKSFSWPPDLLSAIGIPRQDLGIFALMQAHTPTAVHDVYLPLRLRQRGDRVGPTGYTLVIVPGVELKEVFLTLGAVGAATRELLKNGEPLGYGYYPAERPLEIPVAGISKPGIYRLEIGATQRNGGVTTTELWFYHPRR